MTDLIKSQSCLPLRHLEGQYQAQTVDLCAQTSHTSNRITLSRHNGAKYRERTAKSTGTGKGESCLTQAEVNLQDGQSLEWGKTKEYMPWSDNRK